jgi:hypothetical protein
VRKQLAITAAVLACTAGPVLAACSSSGTSTVYVSSGKVKAQEVRWVQQGSSDVWVWEYWLLLANLQSIRVSQGYWNSAVPAQTTVYYNSTASGAVADPADTESATEEQDDESLSEEDTASEEDQEYDSDAEEESGISDDTEEEFSEDEDEGLGDDDALVIRISTLVFIPDHRTGDIT